MKKCPYCKSEIAEDSRFCIYCMSSLEEKQVIKFKKNKKRQLITAVLVVLLCIILVIGVLWNAFGKDVPNDLTGDTVDTTEDTYQKSAAGEASYICKTVKAGDNYNLFYSIPQGACVIVGVDSVSDNGEYIIPDEIEGKTVMAIMDGAFCGDAVKDTVKKVIVPETVKRIDNGAFGECRNLTDIYFTGESIYVYKDAFASEEMRNGTLTIHCSYDCDDMNMRYYRDICADYGAEYGEWRP